jgi:hypothetical protein
VAQYFSNMKSLTGLLGREKSYIFVTFWPRMNPTLVVDISANTQAHFSFQLSIVLASTNCKDEDCSGRICCVLISY